MRFRNPDASWDWLLHDGLGSVRGVFDGTLQSAAEYDPFGEPIVSPIGTAYGFTGELTDGNGLVYLRARYLAPGLGTFASRDPWRGSASAPRTWNGYAWVEGNVVNRVDPGGMAACLSRMSQASLQVSVPCSDFDCCVNRCAGQSGEAFANCMDDCAVNGLGIGLEPHVIFFGGTFADATKEGPDPAIQTPVWVDKTLIPTLAEVRQYPGNLGDDTGKARHVALVSGDYSRSDVVLIGYSGGADSAVMWMDAYQRNPLNSGQVTDLIILGGTMSGTMPDGGTLREEWENILRAALVAGTDIYILDDEALSDPDWAALNCNQPDPTWRGTCTYVSNSRTHYADPTPGLLPTATNNDPTLVREIMEWIDQF